MKEKKVLRTNAQEKTRGWVLWYADHGARRANFNIASLGARIPVKKIEKNNISLMEPPVAREMLSSDDDLYLLSAGRSPRENVRECKAAARIDEFHYGGPPAGDDAGTIRLCVKL